MLIYYVWVGNSSTLPLLYLLLFGICPNFAQINPLKGAEILKSHQTALIVAQGAADVTFILLAYDHGNK